MMRSVTRPKSFVVSAVALLALSFASGGCAELALFYTFLNLNSAPVSAGGDPAPAGQSIVPPTVIDIAATTPEETPVSVSIVTGDSAVDAVLATLTATIIVPPSDGTVAIDPATKQITYTPNTDFNGIDAFSVLVCTPDQPPLCATATGSITVTPVNDPPVAVDEDYTTDEDTPLIVPAPGPLANDSDVDTSDTLTAVLVTAPAHGTLTLNADGSFQYSPDSDFNGTDSFTYQCNDGAADSNVATVNITVNPINDPPVAVDDSYVTDVNTPLIVPAPGLLANDSDVDGSDALVVNLVSAPAHGAVILSIVTGSITYYPSVNFTGTDSFSYRCSDGTASSNVATVTITVNPTSAAPIAVNGPGVLPMGSPPGGSADKPDSD